MTALIRIFLALASLLLTLTLALCLKISPSLMDYLCGVFFGGFVFVLSLRLFKLPISSAESQVLLLDSFALSDPRLLDFAATGLLDKRLLLPRFIVKELPKGVLEVVKKLESLPELDLRFHERDFPEIKEPSDKLLHLAHLLNAPILTADQNRSPSGAKGIRFINLHALSSTLKPLMQRGESLRIKIQRPGKEEGQGIGYLEDGTMIVVNGGGEYLGEVIEVSVLSIKHTAAGRMIFCNVLEGAYAN